MCFPVEVTRSLTRNRFLNKSSLLSRPPTPMNRYPTRRTIVFLAIIISTKKIAEKVRKSGRHFWAIWGNCGPFWIIFGPLWIILGHSRVILGHLGSYLGHFGSFWAILGHFQSRQSRNVKIRYFWSQKIWIPRNEPKNIETLRGELT